MPNPNCAMGAEGCNCAVRGARVAPDRRPSSPFFGVTRTTAPQELYGWRTQVQTLASEIQGLSYGQVMVDEARDYNDRINALLSAYQDTAAFTPPFTIRSQQVWPTFLSNWGAVGAQYERKVFCQPLLSA